MILFQVWKPRVRGVAGGKRGVGRTEDVLRCEPVVRRRLAFVSERRPKRKLWPEAVNETLSSDPRDIGQMSWCVCLSWSQSSRFTPTVHFGEMDLNACGQFSWGGKGPEEGE